MPASKRKAALRPDKPLPARDDSSRAWLPEPPPPAARGTARGDIGGIVPGRLGVRIGLTWPSCAVSRLDCSLQTIWCQARAVGRGHPCVVASVPPPKRAQASGIAVTLHSDRRRNSPAGVLHDRCADRRQRRCHPSPERDVFSQPTFRHRGSSAVRQCRSVSRPTLIPKSCRSSIIRRTDVLHSCCKKQPKSGGIVLAG